MNNSRPDILVAIDLGTTYTGVGWARPQANQALQTPIQVIYNWPGCSTRNEQKVHTCLVYGPDEQQPSSWGFLCEDDDGPDRQRKEFFKIFLDKLTLLEAQSHGLKGAPKSIAEAQRLVSDYLTKVYEHVKSTIEYQTEIGSYVGWDGLAVEFIFSVPTTWRSLEIINTFKTAIETAGFGKGGTRHTATVELTESEAAAVATIKSTTVTFQKGDIFLSIDAGGGTTDFALIQVVEAREPFPTMRQLSEVDGVGIGATLIDRAFLSLVQARLYPFPALLRQLPHDCIEKLVKGEKFRTTKHKFGERVYTAPVYKLPMEGVGYEFNHQSAGIEAGRFLLSKEEMQSLFDPHIDSILKKIREQLDWVSGHSHGQSVQYMILSGGLGSSTYVRDRLQQDLLTTRHPSAPRVQIIQAPDPQLVVVKGLLLDRMQRLDTGNMSVLVTRKARASYGVLCKTKYNPAIHFNEDLQKDAIDGEMYAMGQIDWLIKKGDTVDPNIPIQSNFSFKIDPSSVHRVWDAVVVVSHSEPEFLPRSTKDTAAKTLCTVRSDLSGVKDHELILKTQARACFRSKKWFICNFDVRAIVAPADLRFELWFNGQKLSGSHEPIKVTWDKEGVR